MRVSTLADWLAWQETLHPKAIDLGLERVGAVAEILGVRRPAPLVISIAGTNGKGSSLALLEAILEAAGLRVGAYSSPHLLRYNERIRLAGREVDDAGLIESFARIDQARGEVSLSYFEFGTLAALDIFHREKVEVALLEVGLGGRLDAVNVVDADCALLTTIGIDHSDWLGDDREAIGREKAGIFRPAAPAVCADPQPPQSVRRQAAAIGAEWHALGEDFDFRRQAGGWDWQGPDCAWRDLPLPALPGEHQLRNAAGALMVLAALRDRLPVEAAAIEQGLRRVRLAGRFQRREGAVERIVDVAHNPQAAEALAGLLALRPVAGRTLGVCGMLADKDVEGVAGALAGRIDRWLLGSTPGARGLPAAQLAGRLQAAGIEAEAVGSVAQAWRTALDAARPGDRVVGFGSFHSVAEILALGL
ncbi:bifunctional tetrahydrofolate synthase/dihydrofolate synthase [Thiohalobacter sp. IOR34]|uniref:bifunctional tetrahydrofolate synthase/dihydrofolate synthase n=1 Tax=Thiohalobacter sp. IOR34 TaxID=3057176 RepID=UPI0025B04B93|nr:bifunctional tetrahydrofolate synthase/dihydrofolate synthase [Thiohalobacter sp. IOR34]WJW74512.1 bifunctional tetrahydrofolate synthase/dihydrofolate synthase [Thiohalobacter sp. IOR34]